eukprot:CAMPEP_0179032510 /NCGR_PEP_ID=MMETSP0796-20121207/11624_1 /TAXON_ID=73915 /ORGANISM="Pyrodinium bahamense, Strain pbaha01" /LENGTH=280 /DNA_ID=CAMNT_0020728737 /DNA_START=260 /DNA_END=1099 /DNA_ORIENTATION=-
MESMYEVAVETSDGDLEVIRAAASGGEVCEVTSQLAYRVAIPLEPTGRAELRVVCPHQYPVSQALEATCSLDLGATSGRKLDESVNELLAERCKAEMGAEAVMGLVMWLCEEGSSRAAEAAEAESARARQQLATPPAEWLRVVYWIDHMLEGRQHKKEAAVVEAATSMRMTGMLFYGAPSVFIVEGVKGDHDELVRDARKAGKTLKPKKSQTLANGPASAHYSKLATISGESLDVDTLQQELKQLGLEHKYRFILGIEEHTESAQSPRREPQTHQGGLVL